jgi:predicted CopG family antitoxin
MTESKTIRLDMETYNELCRIAGVLQTQLGHPISLGDAIKFLLDRTRKKNRISDLAGTWDVTDEEIKEIKESLEKGWMQWKIKI